MNKSNGFKPLPLTAAIALAIGSQTSGAEERPELEMLTKPTSQASIGLGVVDSDNEAFGLYNGLEESGAYLLLDFDVNRRDDETGTWTRAEGRDLGTDLRELRFEQQRQGQWKYFIEYGEITRNHPYDVNTGLSGIGTNTQLVTGTTPRDVDLAVEREKFKIGAQKHINDEWNLKVTYRHEDKEGDRAWGAGFGPNFLTEPVDYRLEEFNAVLGYTADRLQLSGGYLASLFGNKHKVLNSDSGTTELSLPLDNQAHKLYLNGGYNFTPTTRGSFKVSYNRLTQDDTFYTPAERLSANGATDLDAEVITKELMARVTSRPMDRLYLKAGVRYLDRDDRTPRVQFISANARRDGFNVPHSRKRKHGELEAAYALPQDYKLTAGVEFEETERSEPPLRSTSYRERVDEATYRLEVKRRMTDSISGSIAYLYSDRDGSDFLESGNTESLDPINLADRERNKWRLSLDWMPTDVLSFQARFEQSDDDYDIREHGPRDGESQFMSLDAAYHLNDEWQLTAWLSRDETEIDQQTQTSGGTDWTADLSHLGRAFGIGLRGETLDELKVGADLQMSLDQSEHLISEPNSSLPDIFYRHWSLKLFVEKPLDERQSLRVDYVYDRLTTDDWTWENFTYADGTTITQDPKDDAHFIGLTYNYRYW